MTETNDSLSAAGPGSAGRAADSGAAPSGSPTRPVALVTGASRGIGLAVAHELGRTHHVIVHARREEPLRELVGALPSAEVWAAELDGDFAAPALDRLDVLVHSAGIEEGTTIENTTREEWRRVLEVNVVAVAELTRQLLPALRAARGTVVAINSGSGFTSAPGGSVYAGSKFALRALTDALREEERESGVRVSSVHPGRVDTDMQRQIVAKKGGEYDTSLYLEAQSIADAVRLVVDLPHNATAEVVSVRPTKQR